MLLSENMPHHRSKHRAPPPHTMATGEHVSGYADSQRPSGNDAFPPPIERQRLGIQSAAMPVPPQSQPYGWPQANVSGNAGDGMYHRVPESPDVKKRIRKPLGEGVVSEPSDRSSSSSVASVLLLAAAAQQKADEQTELEESSNTTEDPSRPPPEDTDERQAPSSPSSATTLMNMETSRPIKKRKTDESVNNQTTKPVDPCNVSPMSHHSTGRATSAELGPMERSPGSETIGTNPSSSASFEDRNREQDPESQDTEQGKTEEIPPQGHLSSRKPLPVALHWLLTESTSQTLDFAASVRSVMQWLPHGQAWKIVRWDAFRRQILPQFFPEFGLPDGTASIDAFLRHLGGWGFEEIRDGPDVGAFAHTVRTRLFLSCSF